MYYLDLVRIADFAKKSYDDANCEYDGKSYFTHIEMVASIGNKYRYIFKSDEDFEYFCAAIFLHDGIEDARLTYNNILEISNEDVADIVLAVTDTPAENRLLRHLLTMPRTVKDYRAIILKMCDIHANASYSKSICSSMFKKYAEEYLYRKPIFQKALTWYTEFIDIDEVNKLWNELDEIFLK